MPHCLDAQVLASSSHQAAARHSQQCQLRTGVCHQFSGHSSLKAKVHTRRSDKRSGRRCNSVTHAAVAEAAPDVAMRGEWKTGYTTTATSEITHANPFIQWLALCSGSSSGRSFVGGAGRSETEQLYKAVESVSTCSCGRTGCHQRSSASRSCGHRSGRHTLPLL